MLYQLPNGKVISLTMEEYLSLSDEDIQDLVASNIGRIPTSYWHGSVIKDPKKVSEDTEDQGPTACEQFYSIDFLSIEELESEENHLGGIDINNLPDLDDSDFLDLFE
jgi:hypothetical protein